MNRIRHSLILVTLALTLSACGGDPASHADHGHAHDDHADAEADDGDIRAFAPDPGLAEGNGEILDIRHFEGLAV